MRASAAQLYEPFRKHPVLFRGAPFDRAWVHPDLRQLVELFSGDNVQVKETKGEDVASSTLNGSHSVVKDSTIGGTNGDQADKKQFCFNNEVEKFLQTETTDVYSFNCFDSSFIQMFNEEIENFYQMAEKENIPIRRPNSMNNYGVIVNEIGMRPMIIAFQQEYILPLARVLFPQQGFQLDDHHLFIVRYQSGEDLGLDMHVDDSDVTFNVCMGDVFTGATLSFCGMFGAPNHRKLVHVYHHEVGRAVLHLGNRRHGADNIQTGARSNLIIWNHNFEWRNSDEYKRRRHFDVYEKEEGPPDPTCVSYTHDRDYLAYHRQFPPNQGGKHFHGWCPPPGKEYEGFPRGA
ncbi:hypothetical protein ACA910_000326 [Epithemia clementina (nom. ined.)]